MTGWNSYIQQGLTISKARLPQGATLLGVILSSDKTGLMSITGDHSAHPLLITLANIDLMICSSSSSYALKLLALIPVPKFVGVKKGLHTILGNRLFHPCLDFIAAPLKTAARNRTWMSNYAGYICKCFTPLAAYIADTPEAAVLTGVARKTSHLTMASFKEFGNPFWHPPWMATDILTSLNILFYHFDPSDVGVYTTKAWRLFRLNGVNLPFWCDWELPDRTLPNPSQLFPIEIVHNLHKLFWDHDVKWIIQAIGDCELDTQFSLLQPWSGYHHFSSRISALKQVTGHEHCDIQRYILGLIADSVCPEFVVCIHTPQRAVSVVCSCVSQSCDIIMWLWENFSSI